MKRIFLLLFFIYCFVAHSFSNIDLGLNLSSSIFVGIHDGDINYNLINSKFIFSLPLSDYVTVYSSFLNRFKFNENSNVNDFELYEGYVSVKKFLYKDLEVSFGKERISWGKSDKVNPTDVLNPFDLSDLIDFSTKYPSWALDLKLYIPVFEETFLQLVLEPISMPAKLNEIITYAYEIRIKDKILSEIQANSLTIGKVFSNYRPIDLNITNGIVGVKLSTKVFDISTSLSFVSRKNDMPYVSKVYTTNNVNVNVISSMPLILETNVNVSNIIYYMDYHRESIVGFDISKDLGIVLAWLELGIFLPEKVSTEVDALLNVNSPLGSTNISTNWSESYLKDVYTKYVFGFDKTFNNGLYVNFQFAHGLGIERGFGDEKLQDYFIFNVEKRFFEDIFKVRLYSILNFDGVFSRFEESNLLDALTKNAGVLGAVELSYYPVIGMKLYLSLIGIDANGTSRLYDFRDLDMVSVGFAMEL